MRRKNSAEGAEQEVGGKKKGNGKFFVPDYFCFLCKRKMNLAIEAIGTIEAIAGRKIHFAWKLVRILAKKTIYLQWLLAKRNY